MKRSSLVGFDLIEELDPALPDEEKMLERIYETLMLCDGASSMRTFRGRFEQLDQEIEDIVCRFLSSQPSVRIHDVAASSAVTTLELFKKLSNIPNGKIEVTASDLCTKIDVYRVSDHWRLINFSDEQCRTGKKWIQAVGKKVVVNAKLPLKKVGYSKTMFTLNWLLAACVELCVIIHFKRRISAKTKRTVSLFHPHAISLASQEERFKLRQYDLLNPSPEQYEVVRAMTVLGRFRGTDFEKAVKALAGAVADNGYLIVGFGRKECSIFKKRGNKMLHYKDVGEPFKRKKEIERIYSCH